MEKVVQLYHGCLYGVEVSPYGIQNGYVDYRTLSRIIGDCILNNQIYRHVDDWEIVCGECEYEQDGDYYCYETYQQYIITERGAQLISEYFPDEVVWYSETFDIYLWDVHHYGTAWDYVLTNTKIDKEEKTYGS